MIINEVNWDFSYCIRLDNNSAIVLNEDAFIGYWFNQNYFTERTLAEELNYWESIRHGSETIAWVLLKERALDLKFEGVSEFKRRGGCDADCFWALKESFNDSR